MLPAPASHVDEAFTKYVVRLFGGRALGGEKTLSVGASKHDYKIH